MCGERVPFTLSKTALARLAGAARQLDPPGLRALEDAVLAATSARRTAYEDAIAAVREQSAAQHEACGELRAAAAEMEALYALATEAPDAQDRAPARLARCTDLCVRGARLLAAAGDHDAAQRLLQRGAERAAALPAADAAAVAYRLQGARLADLRHDFARAAQRYGELARDGAVPADTRADCLHACARCAVLAPAGPERARVLAALCRDERTRLLPCGAFLQMVHSERILRPADVAAFARTLDAHQRPSLARAVVQHNMLSAANVYTSIRIAELGRLLGISADEGERVAADMICAGRVNATIDQVSGLVYFGRSLSSFSSLTLHQSFHWLLLAGNTTTQGQIRLHCGTARLTRRARPPTRLLK